MEKEKVKTVLTSIFKKVFDDPSIQLNDQLSANDIAQWDSLTHMVLISAVEAEFGVKFRLKELNRMQNVGDMIALIVEKKTISN